MKAYFTERVCVSMSENPTENEFNSLMDREAIATVLPNEELDEVCRGCHLTEMTVS